MAAPSLKKRLIKAELWWNIMEDNPQRKAGQTLSAHHAYKVGHLRWFRGRVLFIVPRKESVLRWQLVELPVRPMGPTTGCHGYP